MIIEPFYEKQSGTWSYLLADAESGSCAIIDPVWVYEPVTGVASREFTDTMLARARELSCKLEWVLETHAHADHLSSGGLIRQETGARIAAGRGICSVQKTFKKVYNLSGLHTDGRQFDRLFCEGDVFALGKISISVWETPGHTLDSISYLAGDAAFIGDTLFVPDAGSARCDFPGGNASQLFDSIQRIHRLPGETRLFLCHDYPDPGEEPRAMVRVAESVKHNIHAKAGTTREAFIEMREKRDAGLALPRLILPAIQVNVLAGAAPPAEDNGASYLKIPFNTSIRELIKEKE